MAPLSRGILILLVTVIAKDINTNGESLEKYRYCSRPCVTGSAPKICRYEFSVSELPNLNSVCHASSGNDTHLRPDCSEELFGTGVLGINGKTPGPQIEICLGDTLEVILKNGLGTAEVSLHWHGLRQKGFAHMDGVPMVTQCPVMPFSSFRYEMKPESSGSYLYYAQSAPQHGDGLYGVLIVRDAESDPKLEKTLLLSASLKAPLTQIWSEFTAPTDLLVNGKKNGYRIIVNENRRYLMRLINANAVACPVLLSIAAHEFMVVAVDGQKVERPASASHVVLFPERGMEWTRDKTLELLHAYQQRRVLWDWSARGYRDRTKRRRAIQELAEILNCNTLEIEKKITNLKCQYSREVHKIQNSRDVATGPEDIYVSKWFAFKAMQFLQFGTRRYSKRKKKVDQLKLEEEEYIVSDIDPESIAFHDCSDGTNGSASGSIINASFSEDAEESFSSSMKMEERLGSVTLNRDERSLGRDEDGDPEEIKVEVDTAGDHDRRKSKEDFMKFGESIAAQLAQVPDSYSRSVAKLRINQILFEAEIGVYAQTRS